MAPVLLGYASPHWDGLDFFGPYQVLAGDYARSGRFLIWNPFTSFGGPDGIDPQIGAFSPLVVMAGALFGGSRHGFESYWLVMWLLGPLGLLRLARHLHVPDWGAYVAAVSWALSGFYTGHAEHTAWITSMAFLPWVLWRLDVAVSGRRLWPAVEAGALFGLSALAGYPGLSFVNACFAAAWSLGRSLPHGQRNGLLWAAGLLSVMSLVAAVVLSPTYAAFIVEGAGYSHRTGALTFDVAVRNNALHPKALLTLLNPSLALGDGFAYTDVSMRSLYVGLVVPVLAAISLRRPSALRWVLVAVGIFCLAAAMGVALPVRGWLYSWVPPTRFFRNAALFRIYAMLALTLLAMLGSTDGLFQRARGMLPIALVVFATADMLFAAYLTRSLIYGQPVSAWTDMAARHVPSLDLTARGLARDADNGGNLTFITKVPAAAGYAPLTGPLVREYMSEPVLLDAATGPNRLWFSAGPIEAPRSSACLASLRRTAHRLGAPPLVIHRPDAMTVLAETGDCPSDLSAATPARRLDTTAVQVSEYTPERLRLRVRVEEAGWLLVTDSWARGWRARVNGRVVDAAGGNFLFRAVPVGAGANSVEFRYRPFGYPWLLVPSWGTLGIIAAAAARRANRSSRRSASR